MLRLEAVHAFYGAGHILHGVDLDIPRAQVTALLGRNGVGKTTTVRTIMGLVAPRGGRVRLGDNDIAGWPPHRIARAGVAYVPEGRLIFPDLSVVENIRVAERVPARQWTLARLFDLFPSLAERSRNKGAQLSGGEQQMLALARALATDPQVMLLDEPSQGLAPLVVRELARVILRLRDEGVTVLLVEQNLKFAEAVTNNVAMLVKGRTVYQGTLSAFQAERETLKAKYLTV
jgi:branched-chain amino acid transport system ATP-binding protein